MISHKMTFHYIIIHRHVRPPSDWTDRGGRSQAPYNKLTFIESRSSRPFLNDMMIKPRDTGSFRLS